MFQASSDLITVLLSCKKSGTDITTLMSEKQILCDFAVRWYKSRTMSDQIQELVKIQELKKDKLARLQQKLADLRFQKLDKSSETDTTMGTVDLVPMTIQDYEDKSVEYQPSRFDKGHQQKV